MARSRLSLVLQFFFQFAHLLSVGQHGALCRIELRADIFRLLNAYDLGLYSVLGS